MALIDNCIHYYKFDESAGASADDEINGANLTLNNMEDGDWTAAKINNGLNFGGTNEDATVAAFSEVEKGKNWTISFWFKTPDVSQITAIIANNSADRVNIGLHNTDYLSIRLWSAASDVSRRSNSTISDNTWYHVVLAHSSDNTFVLYLNNVIQTDTTVLNDTPMGGTFSVGSRNGVRWYTGIVDEVGVWSRTLNATEVGELYNSGDGFQYPFTAAGTNTQINVDDAWKDVSAIKVNVDDAEKSVIAALVNKDDAWKTIF